MKSLLLSLAAGAALAGCAGYYGDPYYGSYGYPAYSGYGYGYAQPSVSIGVYGTSGGRGYGYGDGRSYGDGRGWRDRDHDGIPNRRDADRDGDGVPNRADARPNNPRRR